VDILNCAMVENRDFFIKTLQELIRIDTHTIGHGIAGGLEKEGQEYLENLMRSMGAKDIIIDPLEESVIQKALQVHHEGNLGHNNKDRYNLYARFPGGKGKSILFNGHIDTMPADTDQWSRDPFDPHIEDGKMYGLGVADMKAGLLSGIMAVKLLQEAGIRLPGDVIVTSVADEEGGGNGSIQAAMRGIKADAAVVCEPTNRELIVAHMGFVFFEVTVEGVSVHSGNKGAGINAIDKAFKLIKAIEELEHKWLLTHKHPYLPAPNSNVGVIEGGSAGSTVPDRCVFKTCVHYLPEVMDYSSVVQEYTEAINTRCNGDEWLQDHLPKIRIYQAGGPFEMDVHHPFVSEFQSAYHTITGEKVKLVGSPAGCDSRVWKNIAEVPTIQYGPGALEQCHAVDEYIEIEDYLETIRIFAELILRWGNNEGGKNE